MNNKRPHLVILFILLAFRQLNAQGIQDGLRSLENEQYSNYILQTNQDGKNSIIPKTITWTPAFYKCFDELLVNAYDHKKRMDKVMETDKDNHHPVTIIKVNINDDQSISFYNDGDGIQIEYMEEHKMYPPELIFGSLLTSTNYDDNEQREWGGRNGYGAKLANIFSKRFEIETVCHVNKKKYKQLILIIKSFIFIIRRGFYLC
jgi:DNA topoisomerase-2